MIIVCFVHLFIQNFPLQLSVSDTALRCCYGQIYNRLFICVYFFLFVLSSFYLSSTTCWYYFVITFGGHLPPSEKQFLWHLHLMLYSVVSIFILFGFLSEEKGLFASVHDVHGRVWTFVFTSTEMIDTASVCSLAGDAYYQRAPGPKVMKLLGPGHTICKVYVGVSKYFGYVIVFIINVFGLTIVVS